MSQRARERAKQKKQQQRRQQALLLLGGVVAVAVLAVVLIVIGNQPLPGEIPAGVDTRYAGLTQDKTDRGFPVLGHPDAPVRVVEYSSFSCEFCRSFHETTFPSLLERVKRNEIRFVYVPLQTGAIPNAQYAAKVGLCAAEQGKFWEMHDVLFYWHTQYSSNAFAGNRVPSALTALNLNADAFNQCINSDAINQVLIDAQADAVTALSGNVSTPQVTVNGQLVASADQATINQAIDNALAQPGVVIPPVSSETTPEETTPEATAEATAGS